MLGQAQTHPQHHWKLRTKARDKSFGMVLQHDHIQSSMNLGKEVAPPRPPDCSGNCTVLERADEADWGDQCCWKTAEES